MTEATNPGRRHTTGSSTKAGDPLDCRPKAAAAFAICRSAYLCLLRRQAEVRAVARVDLALVRLAAETVGPDDTVWDIGSNLGLFSFVAAMAEGQAADVLAVESDTTLAGLLRRSATLNRVCRSVG